MSKLVTKRGAARPATLSTVLRDTYFPRSEYLKEALHQTQLKAKVVSTQFTEQRMETTGLRTEIAELREKIERVKLEREQILTEKERLSKELEQVMKVTDLVKKRHEITWLEDRIVQAKCQTAELKANVEDTHELLNRRSGLLQMRENEVKMMSKELEKASKQRSILLDKARMCSGKVPVRAVASKSQVETIWKGGLTKGMSKETIKPFTSYGFALNMNQSSGPIKVPPGLNTSRSSNPKEPDPPSSHRKLPAYDLKASSPSVE